MQDPIDHENGAEEDTVPSKYSLPPDNEEKIHKMRCRGEELIKTLRDLSGDEGHLVKHDTAIKVTNLMDMKLRDTIALDLVARDLTDYKVDLFGILPNDDFREILRGIKMGSLFMLSMESCLLTDAHIYHLVEAMRSPEAGLVCLNVANNRITDEGAYLLLEYLVMTPCTEICLRTLDISRNPRICRENQLLIRQQMRMNNTLRVCKFTPDE